MRGIYSIFICTACNPQLSLDLGLLVLLASWLAALWLGLECSEWSAWSDVSACRHESTIRKIYVGIVYISKCIQGIRISVAKTLE